MANPSAFSGWHCKMTHPTLQILECDFLRCTEGQARKFAELRWNRERGIGNPPQVELTQFTPPT